MKKMLSTPLGQILYSSTIFLLAFILLHFSPLNMIHGRSDAALIVGIFGVIALLVSYVFRLKLLTLTATFGYIIAFILGVIFQTNGVDSGGGSTNNLWEIWLISYWIFLGLGFLVNVILKKKSITKYLSYPIFFVMGGVIGGFGADLFIKAQGDDITILSFILFLVSIVLAMYFQIIVHELGHLVFGLLTGYTFSSFRIGSCMVMKDAGKLRLKRIKIAGTGGQCLMIPPTLRDNTMPYALYGFGGCFANLIISVLFLLFYMFLSNVLFWGTFSIMTVICGVAFAILNGIPMKGLVSNDGYNVLEQKRNSEAVYSMWVQLSVNEKLAKGESLRNIPDECLYMPDEHGLTNVLVATIGVFYANRLLAMQKFTEATEAIDQLLQGKTAICELHRKLLVCDKIYCVLVSGKSFESIGLLYNKTQKQFMKQMKKFPSVLRTTYAIELLYNGNDSEAEKTLHAFHAIAKTYPYQGDMKDELNLIEITSIHNRNRWDNEK